jgi:hypothetical protein
MELRQGSTSPSTEELTRIAEQGDDSLRMLGALYILERVAAEGFDGDAWKLQVRMGGVRIDVVYAVLGLARANGWALVTDDSTWSEVELSPGATQLRVGKKIWTFTPSQRPVIQALYDAWRQRLPCVAIKDLQRIKDVHSRMPDLFRRNPAWKTLIVQGDTAGTLKLNLPTRDPQ